MLAPSTYNRPTCMDSGELARWTEANAVAPKDKRAPCPCADCLPDFRRAAILAGRCNAAGSGPQ